MADLYDWMKQKQRCERTINKLKAELNAAENELLHTEWIIDRVVGSNALKLELVEKLVGKQLDRSKVKALGFTDGQVSTWEKILEYITNKRYNSDVYPVNEASGQYNANSARKLVEQRYLTEETSQVFRSTRTYYSYRITVKGIQFLLDNVIE